MKEHVRQNEELGFELERLNMQLQKLSHEKEHNVELRKEDKGALEVTMQRVEKQTKVINKICRDVSKVQELVNSISREFQLSGRILSQAEQMGQMRPT